MASGDSNSLSPPEVRALFQQNSVSISDKEVADLMSEMDTNHDGEIDLEEFLVLEFNHCEICCVIGVGGWLVGGWDKWETTVGLMG